MADVTQYKFDYQEVVEALIKRQGLREGIWQLGVEFGLAAINVGGSQSDLKPAAVVPVVKILIDKVEKETNLTVDASKVNPP